MQIRKLLRNYLATTLMDMPFLEKNTHCLLLLSEGFCVVIYVYGWLDPTRGHLMWRIFVHGNKSNSCSVSGIPQATVGITFDWEGSREDLQVADSLPLLPHWILLRRAVRFRHTWKRTSSGEESKLTLSSNHVPRTVGIYSTNMNWAPRCASLISTEDRTVYIVGWMVAAKKDLPTS